MKSPEEKKAIADFVLDWYNSWLLENKEMEKGMLEEINVETLQGKFEVIILGTLFSQWRMSEERAYRTWIDTKKWFNKNEFDYFEFFSGEDSAKWNQLRQYSATISFPNSALWNLRYTLDRLKNENWDLNNLVIKNNWKDTITNIQYTCDGIYQKAFWIARVMKQKGVWDIPGEFCCVSDSHIKSFLEKARFIYDTSNLFRNSKLMWDYFNEGRPEAHYDLPLFRFARDKGKKCKKCSELCNLATMQKCANVDSRR